MAEIKNKKDCDKCEGKGKVFNGYEYVWLNTGMMPGEGHYENRKIMKDCDKCGGKGYLELKWV